MIGKLPSFWEGLFSGAMLVSGGYIFCISPKANLSILPKKNFKTFNNLCFFEVCEEVHKKYKDKSKSTPQWCANGFGCSVVVLKGIRNDAAKIVFISLPFWKSLSQIVIGTEEFFERAENICSFGLSLHGAEKDGVDKRPDLLMLLAPRMCCKSL